MFYCSEMLQMSHPYANQNVPVGAPNLYMLGKFYSNKQYS